MSIRNGASAPAVVQKYHLRHGIAAKIRKRGKSTAQYLGIDNSAPKAEESDTRNSASDHSDSGTPIFLRPGSQPHPRNPEQRLPPRFGALRDARQRPAGGARWSRRYQLNAPWAAPSSPGNNSARPGSRNAIPISLALCISIRSKAVP